MGSIGGLGGCARCFANGNRGYSFGADGAIIPDAGGSLGADHHPGDRAVVTGSGSNCFLAALSWNGAWALTGALVAASNRGSLYSG
jgi:hypothetical protein